MAKAPLIYTKEALQDLLDIADYHFEKVGEDSALRAVGDLQDHIEKLSDFPRMGEEHPDTYLNALGFRKLVHGNHIVGIQQLPGIVPLTQQQRKTGVCQAHRLCGWYRADACLFWGLYRVMPLCWRCCLAQFFALFFVRYSSAACARSP